MVREWYAKQTVEGKVVKIVMPIGMLVVAPMFLAIIHDIYTVIQRTQHDADWLKMLLKNQLFCGIMLLSSIVTVIGVIIFFREEWRKARASIRHANNMVQFAGSTYAPTPLWMKLSLACVCVLTALACLLVFGPNTWVQSVIALF